ncbi:hypothetical protein FQR65_LT09827 [Abscondita terminalis]|nr:hypothetical protein FQR65_LT09827 [Abscondita terminalis]
MPVYPSVFHIKPFTPAFVPSAVPCINIPYNCPVRPPPFTITPIAGPCYLPLPIPCAPGCI